jgi:hypothetical protein
MVTAFDKEAIILVMGIVNREEDLSFLDLRLERDARRSELIEYLNGPAMLEHHGLGRLKLQYKSQRCGASHEVYQYGPTSSGIFDRQATVLVTYEN